MENSILEDSYKEREMELEKMSGRMEEEKLLIGLKTKEKESLSTMI